MIHACFREKSPLPLFVKEGFEPTEKIAPLKKEDKGDSSSLSAVHKTELRGEANKLDKFLFRRAQGF
jgi:hypothetical protein